MGKATFIMEQPKKCTCTPTHTSRRSFQSINPEFFNDLTLSHQNSQEELSKITIAKFKVKWTKTGFMAWCNQSVFGPRKNPHPSPRHFLWHDGETGRVTQHKIYITPQISILGRLFGFPLKVGMCCITKAIQDSDGELIEHPARSINPDYFTKVWKLNLVKYETHNLLHATFSFERAE